jgi:hypothetical protein
MISMLFLDTHDLISAVVVAIRNGIAGSQIVYTPLIRIHSALAADKQGLEEVGTKDRATCAIRHQPTLGARSKD